MKAGGKGRGFHGVIQYSHVDCGKHCYLGNNVGNILN